MPSGVYERTEKIRFAHSRENWSDETRERKRISHLKENLSDETLERMRKAQLGKHYTNEAKEKMRLAHLGKPSPMKGKHHTKEAIKKMRLSQKGKPSGMLGKRHTKKSIEKMRETLKGRIPWNKGKTGCYSEEILKRILHRRIPTSLEEKFQSIVNKYNLPYKYVGDGSFIIGRYNPDFINTNSEKIAVEVYARYYKKRNNISIEDWKIKRSEVFRQYGWEIVYFNEIEVNEENVLSKLC